MGRIGRWSDEQAKSAAGVLFALLIGVSPAAGQDAATARAEALEHFRGHRIEPMAAALDVALAATPDPDAWTDALLDAALLRWRYHQDHDSAFALLDRGLEIAERTPELLAERTSDLLAARARARADAGDFGAAADDARAALHTAHGVEERVVARTWLSRAAAAAALAEADAESFTPATTTLLGEAVAAYRAGRSESVGILDEAAAAMRAALLLGDGQAALDAWRSYYVLVLEGEGVGVLGPPADTLARLLPIWSRSPATDEHRAAIARALLRSGMAAEARVVAMGIGRADERPLPGREMREVIDYAAFTEALGSLAREHYRRTAVGLDSDAWFAARRDSIGAQFLSRLYPDPSSPRRALAEVLSERFHVDLRTGRTSGYLDLHMGHRVVDEEIGIEQYGYRAQLRFVATDGLVSNGFQSWAWDHRTQHGGTADPGLIVQFRPAYASAPLLALTTVEDSAASREFQEDMEREEARDRRIALDRPVATFRGLSARLTLQGLDRIVGEIRDEGLSGEPFRRAFVARFAAAVFESSIVAHEGRHAIDAVLERGLSSEELEYRAKLSEVALSHHPRLAILSVLSVDGDDPHSRANRRILTHLLEWMDRHRSQIERLDQEAPLLPQLHLLSDQQLRAALAELDPLAR